MTDFPVEAEIAGTVWKIEAGIGDDIEDQGVIMILESMKMEIAVLAPEAGTLAAIHVAEGDTVREGQELATMSRAT
jgi:biotin carboxyl carrier protein